MADLVASSASASIDVSDGLVADAGHVADASSVALVIETASVPLSAAGQGFLANARADLRALLTGGDDYQTLFTAPASAREAITASGQTVTRIGRVEQGQGVRVLDASGSEMTLDKAGWNHFSG
jgi:thiamine-monophosphate kinase